LSEFIENRNKQLIELRTNDQNKEENTGYEKEFDKHIEILKNTYQNLGNEKLNIPNKNFKQKSC
jgi:hypothetical protein